MRIGILLCASILACAAGWIFWGAGSGNKDAPLPAMEVSAPPLAEPVFADEAASVPTADSDGSASSAASQTRKIRAANEPQAAEILAALENSRDFRVVYQYLLANPDDRSGLYAKHILMMCILFRDWKNFTLPPTQSTRQDEARRTFEDRCASFTVEEASGQGIDALLKDPRIEGRYIHLQQRLRAMHESPDKERAILSEILQIGDPLLLQQMMSTILAREPDGVTLGGRRFDQPYARTAFDLAWSSAVCDVMGTGCGAQEMNVVDVCARHGLCMDSRQALNEELMRLEGAEELALYREWLPRFREAIQNRDASMFIRPAPQRTQDVQP